MANVTTKAAGGTSTVSTGHYGEGLVFKEFDIATDYVAQGGLTTEYAVIANIPADTFFELLQVEVITALALGAGARIDLGDSADDDEFVSNASTLTAGTNLTILKTDGSSGAVYTAADTLRLKVTGGTIATGKLRFVFRMLDTTRLAPAVSKTYTN
jgi:hypothetical protein